MAKNQSQFDSLPGETPVCQCCPSSRVCTRKADILLDKNYLIKGLANTYLQILRMETEIKEAEGWWKRNTCKKANCRSELVTKVNMMDFRLEQLLKRKVELYDQKLQMTQLVEELLLDGFFLFRDVEIYLKK